MTRPLIFLACAAAMLVPLASPASGQTPAQASERAPERAGVRQTQPPPEVGEYRLSGDAALRPSLIADDGSKTYIQWLDEQPMPAVFGIGPSGDEEMVEGHMRAGVFTIDRVYAELVFRIDKEKAVAKRRKVGSRR